MKIVQYYVVLLFFNNLKKGVCTFQTLGENNIFVTNDFMLFVQLVLMTVLAYFIDEIKLR